MTRTWNGSGDSGMSSALRTQEERVVMRVKGSSVLVMDIADPGWAQRAAPVLYDALRDWLVRERLVDAGLLPFGALRRTSQSGSATLAVRGMPIGRVMDAPEGDTLGGTLELFLPPYVRGDTALRAACELAAVLQGSGFAENVIVDTGEDHGKHGAA